MPDLCEPTFDPEETLPWAIRTWAAREPDRPFLQEVDGASRTYGEVHAAALRWAGAFRAAGIDAGDNVPTMVRPSLRSREHWLGLGWLRAVQTGVNTDFRGRSLAYVLDDCRARHLICDRAFLPRVAEVAGELDRLRCVIVTDATTEQLPTGFPVDVVAGDDLWAATEPVADAEVPRRHDLACISYTSGTTGASKGVLVPWGRLWPNEAWIDLRGDDVFYCAFPVFHLSGLLPLAWAGFPGGQVVIRDGFKTQRFWEDVRRYGCTTTALIPAMMNWLIDQPARGDDGDNPLRFVCGAPVVPRVEEFKQRFGVQMRTVFGNTEIGTPLYAGPDVTAGPASTAKWVAPGYEVRVVDEHDYEVPVGEIGELVVRTVEPWRMMAGYFGMPEATAAAWRNGWFHTGDGVVQDERGRFEFVDRITDSMRRRGENISSVEVEAHVNEHDAVAETAAIAVPSEDGEDEVKVCVVLHEGVTLPHEELHRFLVERMPTFMVPRYIEYLDDPERTEAMQRIKKPPLRCDPLNASTWDARRAVEPGP